LTSRIALGIDTHLVDGGNMGCGRFGGRGIDEEVSSHFAHTSLSGSHTHRREVGKCSLATCPAGKGNVFGDSPANLQ